MASKSPNPRLGKSQALNIAQNTTQRLATIVPSLTTELSPVTVYQPGASGGVGNELISAPGKPVVVASSYGVWIAPDFLGNGQEYYVQVECFGGGGGGGGGSASAGGGGGGGGEYACETQYPVKPGEAYAYVVGLPGSGGYNNSTEVNPGAAGTSGGMTIFDIQGLGLANGVMANGGIGGDQNAVGIGGPGGTGSQNAIHFNGGSGGTGSSSNSSDNPLLLSTTNGMFVGNSLSQGIILCWYIMNETGPTGGKVNDQSLNTYTGTVNNYSSGSGGIGMKLGEFTAPTQVPAYASPAEPPDLPVATQAGAVAGVGASVLSHFTSQLVTPDFQLRTTSRFTFSCWIQCDPSGTWGNTANGSYAIIANNSDNFNSNSLLGYALFLHQDGTPSNPSWSLHGCVGNGSSRTIINYNIGQTPNQWYYVVMTYNSGTLTLYVNNSVVGTASSSGYTSVPTGQYGNNTLFTNLHANVNWFFGSICNVWWAKDCATATLVAQVYASSAPTGGAGGGASGGPSANGSAGASAAGAVGGTGASGVSQPASLAATTTPGQGGYTGGNAGSSGSTLAPAQGSYGGGGGGSGDMASNPALTVLTVPFSSAAAYCGVDATSNPGTPYSVNQQSNPNSGLTTVLFAGGAATDSGSGSKNSILLLPAGLASMLGNGQYTIAQVYLTFTNALANNPVETILEVGYSADTVLPQTYNGVSLVSYIGAVPIPIGAGAVTYDLTQSGIGTKLQNGTATALVIGPGDTPTFDAYNALAGPEFYCSIFGPGAYDSFGNAEYPYLTIVLQKTNTVQHGSPGQGGGILITAISNANVPIGQVQPFATTDASGNQFAEGYTGPVTAFDPTQTTPGSYVPETWKTITMDAGWSTVSGMPAPQYRMTPSGDIQFTGAAAHASFTGTISLNSSNPLPAVYRPVNNHVWRTGNNGGAANTAIGDSEYTPAGVISAIGQPNGAVRIYLDGVCALN